MASIRANLKTISIGFRKMQAVVETELTRQFDAIAERLLADAQSQQSGYYNLTGNTLTGLSYGLYYKGKIVSITHLQGVKPAIRVKLTKDEIFKGVDYDGRERYFKGSIKTDRRYGTEFATDFLSRYRVKRDGWAIVLCTGTEYSVYIEQGSANVLNETYLNARNIFLRNLKPIPDSAFR